MRIKRITAGMIAVLLLVLCTGGVIFAQENADTKRTPEISTARIGAMTGTTGEMYLKDTYPEAKISSYDNIADAVMALQGGKLDYVVTAYTTALNYVKNNDDVYIWQKDVLSEGVAIALPKEDTQLLAQIEEILDGYRKDGTLDEILSHWIHDDGSEYDTVSIPVQKDAPVLKVAIAANREPMCFVQDNEYVGLDCELIQRIAYDMGMKVEFSDMQFSALIAALESGKADVVISNMTATEERKEQVNFTKDYFENPQVLLARRDASAVAEDGTKRELEITDISELAHKRLAASTGSVQALMAEEMYPEAELLLYQSLMDCTEAVLAGQADVSLVDEPIARDIESQNKNLGHIAEFLREDAYAFVVQKENTKLKEAFDRVMEEFKADGTLEEIDSNWFKTEEKDRKVVELPTSQNGTVVKMAVCSSMPPFVYIKDGDLTGYDIEVAARICEKLGYGLELTDMDFGAMIPAVISGKYDMAAGCISVTPEREESVSFVTPDYSGGIVALVRTVDAGKAETGNPVITFFENTKNSFVKTFLRESRWKLVLDGLRVTAVISILSGIFGSFLGFGICMMRRSSHKYASVPARVFIRIIQGTPVLVFLMILYYIVFAGWDINPIAVAVIGFSINFAAYVSEMMRTGIDAVDAGQSEAAASMGFKKSQAFVKIVFPQAAAHFLPVFKGEFISMVKMTSVVGYIAIQDLTKVSDIIRSRTYEAFFPLISTAVLYFLIAWILTLALSWAEKKVDRKQRKRKIKGVTTG